MRKRYIFIILSWVTLSLLATCKKDKTFSQNEDDGTIVLGPPQIRPKGEPKCQPATANIGKEGGQLSFQNELTLIVPPGAVDANTEFKIQSIQNTLDPSIDHSGFRLYPEDIQFQKPVSLQFNFPEASHTALQMRMIATQGENGVWYGVPTSIGNGVSQIISTTTHFSDWAWFDQFTLRKDKNTVSIGQQVKLSLMEKVLGEIMPANGIDNVPLAALDVIGAATKSVKISNWKIISGPGTLESKTNSKGLSGDAVYTAPQIINTPTDVEIQVEVDSKNGYIHDPKAPNNRRKLGKLVLLTSIRLEPDNFLAVKVGSVFHDFSLQPHASIVGQQMTLHGHNALGQRITLQCKASQPGTYQGGTGQGQSVLSWMYPQPSGNLPTLFINSYRSCATAEVFHNGVAKIQQVEGYIAGQFTGTLYYSDQSCGFAEQKDVEVNFKISRLL